jgi:hypothetical protein
MKSVMKLVSVFLVICVVLRGGLGVDQDQDEGQVIDYDDEDDYYEVKEVAGDPEPLDRETPPPIVSEVDQDEQDFDEDYHEEDHDQDNGECPRKLIKFLTIPK